MQEIFMHSNSSYDYYYDLIKKKYYFKDKTTDTLIIYKFHFHVFIFNHFHKYSSSLLLLLFLVVVSKISAYRNNNLCTHRCCNTFLF